MESIPKRAILERAVNIEMAFDFKYTTAVIYTVDSLGHLGICELRFLPLQLKHLGKIVFSLLSFLTVIGL